MNKKIAPVLLAFLIFFNLNLSGFAKGTLKKFNIGYIASTEHALYFIAKEKGFFREAGLDAELFLFANSGEGVNAIKAGKIDAGSFGVAAFSTFVANGADLSVFGGQGSEGAALIAKSENAAQFNDLNDYKNKKIATVRLSTGDIVFKGYLTEHGLDFKKDLTFYELDTPAAVIEAVKKGTVDAGVVWSPFRTLSEKQGLVIIKQTGELYKNHVCCRQVALTSRLKEEPQVYQKFIGALIKAYHYFKTNHNESIGAISKYVKIDRDVINAEVYGPYIGNSPDPDKSDIIRFWDLMNKTGYLTSDINIAKHINTGVYKNALLTVVKKYPQDEVYKKLYADFKEK